MVLAFTALSYLPLAEATTIGFAAPLFAVILSALVLKEDVGRHRWSAVAVGFLGVLIVMQPQGGGLPAIGLAIAGLSAFGVASVTIKIGRAHVSTPVTNAHLVCRLLLEKKTRIVATPIRVSIAAK